MGKVVNDSPKKKLDAKAREQLILEHAPLVKMVAHRIASRLPPSVEVNDLVSTGFLGLMDAIERYDESRNIKFKTYAVIRIAGTIRDELRSLDWLPRSVRDKAKEIERAQADVERRLGRNSTVEDVASALGIDVEEYHEAVGRVKSLALVSLDEQSSSGDGGRAGRQVERLSDEKTVDPHEHLSSVAVQSKLTVFISRLTEPQRFVLSMYYFEDLSLKEIGKVINVSESRISQLHTQAINRLWADLRRTLRSTREMDMG